jgi:hypothetical protein
VDGTGSRSQYKVIKKSGHESLQVNGSASDVTVLDFWRWAMSDLVSNAPRGVLAEFIVAYALRLTDGVRNPWGAYDLVTSTGIKIEVKSASYLQFWNQKNLSKIIFPIKASRTWDHETGITKLSFESRRQADIYVFCVLAHRDKNTINPLDIDQWDFYVIDTSLLNDKYPKHKTIGLLNLIKIGAKKANIKELSSVINEMFHNSD